MMFSPDSRHLISASTDSTTIVWEVKSAEQTMEAKHHLLSEQGDKDWIRAIAVSPNGEWIGTASHGDTVCLWNISASAQSSNRKSGALDKDRIVAGELCGHRGSYLSVAFSPDGKRLASTGTDLRVLIWNVDGNNEGENRPVVHMSNPHIPTLPKGVVFSADGSRVISVLSGGTVAIWSLEHQQCRLVVDATHLYHWPFRSMRIDPDHPDIWCC
ncbi:hypothetical protein J3458_022183 [Metarhizium acridum]|uniref:uncharacterized protein n=1 Tax=Metarhizium acridum TaxID=92637 RepID=UPI001C6B4648|nr:hypothetical protein J3458_022183 [Metarhizium acridum]